MPYQPPQGWVETVSLLERENLFHEDQRCSAITKADGLVRVDRPGRCRQCARCVRSTATAQLKTDAA